MPWKLRSHIPIGSPARREVADGTESDMRVSLGFLPRWFAEKCDVSFSRDWHENPYYRRECLIKMKNELCTRFPSVSYWDLDNREDLATISGCFGAYVIPASLGFEVKYYNDRWPTLVKNRGNLSLKDIENLSVDKVLSGKFAKKLFSQMDQIESEWGKIHGYLNWQGVLNNGFHLRGQEIFTDMKTRPSLVHKLLDKITEIMILLAQRVQKKQRESGFQIDHICVSNCTLNMISPQDYQEFVLPRDLKIAESFARFGVHTCNWDASPYFNELKKFPGLGYIDMGMTSDLKAAKEIFPEARRAVLYSPVKLQNLSTAEIKEDMKIIQNNYSPCDIVMADITENTADSKVKILLEICRKLDEND